MQDDHPYYADVDHDEAYLDNPMPGGDVDEIYDEILDDAIVDSLVILGLAGVLLFLLYYRNQRRDAHRRQAEEEAAARQRAMGGQAPAALGVAIGHGEPNGGAGAAIPRPPGGPDEAAGWAAGVLGH